CRCCFAPTRPSRAPRFGRSCRSSRSTAASFRAATPRRGCRSCWKRSSSYPSTMAKEEKIRLGGMALANGVLVHGPTSWAGAVRTENGRLKVVAKRKRVLGSRFTSPLVRGPARLVEAFAFLPEVKRALPEAQLPFARGRVVGAVLGSAVVMQRVRRSQLGDTAKELVGGFLSIAPALLSLREGSVAAYHGAEHITIGTYEHGVKREKEHERCGSHLVGPLLATATAGNILASRAPARYRPAARAAAALGALATS